MCVSIFASLYFLPLNNGEHHKYNSVVEVGSINNNGILPLFPSFFPILFVCMMVRQKAKTYCSNNGVVAVLIHFAYTCNLLIFFRSMRNHCLYLLLLTGLSLSLVHTYSLCLFPPAQASHCKHHVHLVIVFYFSFVRSLLPQFFFLLFSYSSLLLEFYVAHYGIRSKVKLA